MDTLYFDASPRGAVVALLAKTRGAFFRIEPVPHAAAVQQSHIVTQHGAVFGIAPVVDYLLCRVPEPSMLSAVPAQRAAQLTMFHHVCDAYLTDVSPPSDFVHSAAKLLRWSKFYAGQSMCLCDLALAEALRRAATRTPLTDRYVEACDAEVRRLNSLSHAEQVNDE